MKYIDKIYGEVNITEPVISELINSPTLQRLKGLPQMGYASVYFPKASHTRFEHSLGVFILLKKFNASLNEQITGLIHDVSHTVFCHMGDYIFKSGSGKNHTFQDKIFKNFVKKTNIPEIFKKYQIDIDYILNEKNFPLKEKPLPDLCADRIDYFLRDGFAFGTLSKKEIKEFLKDLKINQNYWVFQNPDLAKKFAQKYLYLNKQYWSGLEAGIMYGTVANVIKYSLKKEYIRENDIFSTDKEILKKIEKFENKDEKLNLLLNRMQLKAKWRLNKRNYDVCVFCKSRVVDPLIEKTKGKIKRLSGVDKKWRYIVKKESQPKEYYIKFYD